MPRIVPQIAWERRPTISKQREGGSGERIAIMESQMAQSLADLRASREADSKTHQYLRQLLRKQEDDHAQLIAMETRMAMMGMGGGSLAGPSRLTTERRRIVEESEEEEEGAEEEKGVEEKENGVEEDGEGEEMEAEGEGEAPAPTATKTVASEKGKGKEVVE
ncbi:hypothetical protein C8R41DRAFT_914193 [Lentinula lateritia]|uniref:Pinin/SDK/MemA protein domain-containing protein n=1 Tax=Lentinula lateritia TaxID=40482 RepID=A0ABQ8VW61_9AGAR|nr:hypothetical protein C8R41DRAFT_914193 [Lentinula lateritia]